MACVAEDIANGYILRHLTAWLLSFLGWLRFVELQRQFRDPGRNIEAVLALDRNRLKRDRLLESADQDVGARTYAKRNTGRGATVMARQRAWIKIAGRRDHSPQDDG